jgi:hypothetical protein
MFSLLWASRAPVWSFWQIYDEITPVQIIPGETLMAGDEKERCGMAGVMRVVSR